MNFGINLSGGVINKARQFNILAFCFAFSAGAVAQPPHPPGSEKRDKKKVVDAGAELWKSESPLRAIHAHVCGFHFNSSDKSRQLVAHHFCSHLTEEVLQCVIYDSDKKNARLIGIEYIIAEKLFAKLPEDEKKLWHSHNFEVKSGQLTSPGLSDSSEKELMKSLASTYGKTWQTWQVDRGDRLPLGIPQLMMGFTADGQANQQMIDDRDKHYGFSTADKKAKRADIPDAKIDSGADAWQNGSVVQLELKSK